MESEKATNNTYAYQNIGMHPNDTNFQNNNSNYLIPPPNDLNSK